MKHLKSTLLTLAALLCSTVSSAYSFKVDGIFYNIKSSSALTVEITYESNANNSYSGDVVIPATVTYDDKVYTVTSIGGAAFSGCSSLTSIILPEGVTSIGSSAFSGCSSLTSIILPGGVTSIGDYAFSGCSSLTSITLPEGVPWVGYQAFYGCSSLADIHIGSIESWLKINYYNSSASRPNYYGKDVKLYLDGELLTEVEIPATVTSIPSYAFYNCSSLTSIILPEGVTSIGNYAFYNCSSLTSFILPESVTSIYSDAFRGCSSLTSITLPEGVTSIPSYAFYNCSSLTSITLPEGVTSIGSDAFYKCSSLAEIHIGSIESWLKINYFNDSSHPNYYGKDVKLYLDGELLTEVEIPATVTSIPSYAFYKCSSLTSITLPEGVTSIGGSAFSGCSSLADIHIGSIESWLKITYSDSYSYSRPNYNGKDVKLYLDGELLTEVEIPATVTSIPSYAFYNCSSLASITIPASVISIGDYAFNGCSALKELTLEDGNSTLSLGYNYYITGNSVGKGLFYDCPLETLYLGRNLSYRNDNYCGYSPFCNNKSLTNVTIGNGVTTIGSFVFRDCSSLASVNMGNSVATIGEYAFMGCSNLLSITLPESVASIDYKAFSDTKELILKSTTPPILTSSSLLPGYAIIVVPKEAHDDYSTADYWKDLLANITIDDDDARVKNLTLKASDDKSSLLVAIGEENVKFVTNLTISGSINSYDFMLMRNQMPVLRHLNLKDASIVYNAHEHYTGYHTEDNQFPDYGLYNCKLFSLVFPESITSVGTYGVSSNKYLSEVTLSKGVSSIGDYAFYDCDKLTEITLPEGLTSIGRSSFAMCDNLLSVTFPEGVKTIGEYAFTYCEKLTSITLFKGLTSIEKYAFRGCPSLEKVILPPTLKTIKEYAFNSCGKLKEIRIPSSVRTVGDYAFAACTSLNDVYVYTVEPFSIGQSTFAKSGNQFIGTLHAPKVSYWTYYYNTQWNQFANRAEFDEPYENFYLVGDKELDSTTGAIEGDGDKNPDAEMGNNSGLIVEDDIVQDLGNVEIEHNGTNGGSIIVGGEGCVNADKLSVRINVTGGKWYFFCFPFDVKREDIILENGADWVFRYYDGEERANNGKGGWKNVTSDGDGNHLKAATGYIFQCSKTDVLVLTAKNQKLKHEDKYNELVEHITQNAHDASWNFVGNPYLSYYEVTSDDYSAPITVWDGSKYIAIRPGDDDYQLAPFEAFFVQKPEGVANVDYSPKRQHTYHSAQEAAAKARARRRAMPVNPDRLLVNVTLGNGTDSDQTRVVFNNKAAMGYETACDAAKFETAGMPQLYTVDSRAVKYAINERPVAEGIVTLGYTAPAEGVYTLAAPRMDTPIYIKDNLTGTIHDFAEGSYEFASEAGTFDDRFTVIMKAGETGIDNSEFNNQNSELYNVKGQRVNEATEQGIYIKENRKVVIK